MMEMDPELLPMGLDLLSLSRADQTWKQSSSAMNGVQRIENEFNIDLSMPWDGTKLLNYLAACRTIGHKHSTVTSNVSHIRQRHRLEGYQFTADSIYSRCFIDGMRNSDEQLTKRIAMTPKLMLTLKHRLKQSTLSVHDKLLYWCVATWAFAGSFRCGELLSSSVNTFKENDLLGSRVTWTSGVNADGHIEVKLLCPKETRTRKLVSVELLQSRSKMMCPFDAWIKWRKVADRELKIDASLPVFRFLSGKLLSTNLMNKMLKDMLHEDIDYHKHGKCRCKWIKLHF